MLLTDLHLHTHWSDGKHSIAEIVDLYGERNFGAIAITDHVCESESFFGMAAHWLNRSLRKEFFESYLQEIEKEAFRAWKQYRMLVIPGVEITKNSLRSQRSAHILGIGVREWVNPDDSIEKILHSIRAQGGITVAAHPVLAKDPTYLPTLQLWSQRNHLNSLMDAWEVASGTQLFDEVYQSGLPMLANSDLHHKKQLRSWKTILHSKRSEGPILRAIKDQDVTFAYYNQKSVVEDLKLKTVLTTCRPLDRLATLA